MPEETNVIELKKTQTPDDVLAAINEQIDLVRRGESDVKSVKSIAQLAQQAQHIYRIKLETMKLLGIKNFSKEAALKLIGGSEEQLT